MLKGLNLVIDLTSAGGDTRRIGPAMRLQRTPAGSAIHDVVTSLAANGNTDGSDDRVLWDGTDSVVDEAEELVVVVDPNNLLAGNPAVMVEIEDSVGGKVYQRVTKAHPLVLGGMQADDLDQTADQPIVSLVARNKGGAAVQVRCVALPA